MDEQKFIEYVFVFCLLISLLADNKENSNFALWVMVQYTKEFNYLCNNDLESFGYQAMSDQLDHSVGLLLDFCGKHMQIFLGIKIIYILIIVNKFDLFSMYHLQYLFLF